MHYKDEKFIPALGFDWATRFYDPLVRLTTREFAFKRSLIKQAGLRHNQTVLDLACGTGTLSIGIKRRFPGIKVFAIDADKIVLQKARLKAIKYGTDIAFEKSFSDKLPFSNQKFDRVFTTLFFHHLTLDKKIQTIREIARVLKPAGELHFADYGEPTGFSQKAFSNIIKLIDGTETTRDNLNGSLPKLIFDNGFKNVLETERFKTILGTLYLIKAKIN